VTIVVVLLLLFLHLLSPSLSTTTASRERERERERERIAIVACHTYRESAEDCKRERNLLRLWFSLTEPTTMNVIWETSARANLQRSRGRRRHVRAANNQHVCVHTHTHTHTHTNTFLNGRRPPHYYNIHINTRVYVICI